MRKIIFIVIFLMIIQFAIPIQNPNYSVYAAQEAAIIGEPAALNSTTSPIEVSTENISASVLSVTVQRTSEAVQQAVTNDDMQWTKINDPQLNHLEGVCYGNGMYVAVGWGGTSETSADGIIWDKSSFPGVNMLHDVIFADNRFIALGEKGTIIESTDGKNWTKQSADTQESLYCAAWNGKTIVAAGANNTFAVSIDFVKWDVVRLNDTAVHINNIIWDGKSFIACGTRQSIGSYSRNAVIMKSSDGYNWETCSTIGNVTPFSIAFNGSKYVVIGEWGQILLSRDLKNWSESNINSRQPLYSIIWTGERFIACGNGGELQYSTDGDHWRRAAIPVSSKLFAAAHNGARVVIVGESGVIMSSDNMSDWEIRQANSYDYINKGLWDGKRLVAINNSYIYTSDDGDIWQKHVLDVGNNRKVSINDIIWNGSVYAIAGVLVDYTADSDRIPLTGAVLTSPDLENWKCSKFPSPGGLRGIAWGDGRFVTVGDLGNIYTSDDGFEWTAVKTGINKGMNEIVWNGSRFVAAGSEGTVLVSEDGTDWQKAAYNQEDYLHFLKCENDKLFMIGSNSETLYTSDDGFDWRSVSIPDGTQIRDILYFEDKYIAVCSLGVIGVSTDAADWSFDKSPVTAGLDSIIQTGTGLTIIGLKGLVLNGEQ